MVAWRDGESPSPMKTAGTAAVVDVAELAGTAALVDVAELFAFALGLRFPLPLLPFPLPFPFAFWPAAAIHRRPDDHGHSRAGDDLRLTRPRAGAGWQQRRGCDTVDCSRRLRRL